mmetsp:Transcript_8023/g.11986  ORF Transcript_8023/g.11986 Transcript_8023/m.11986 type:complete len:607 (-) Transcript_8023:202-2022(-)
MPKPRFHIMRSLRLQLKSGYLKEEPPAYAFMKRYPPLSKDNTLNRCSMNGKEEAGRSVPYLDLYEKAVAKNPLYMDEKVYPAYWQNEPQALILAKKQYEFMKDGFDEESAYDKAVKYVNEIENNSFLELNSALATLNERGAQASFLSDQSISQEISLWREKLSTCSYDELELADQGEIDFLIQTKILKWNEVDRERRMKEPVFVLQFEKLRKTLFPEQQSVIDQRRSQLKSDMQQHWFTFNDAEKSQICTAQPFYLEDYLQILKKLQLRPDLSRWNVLERESLDNWILDTLAYKAVTEGNSNSKRFQYLNDLRLLYFPMIRFPALAKTFTVPTVDDMKRLLYSNDVGYKRDNGKTFVKRFYRLPNLLFPKETFAARFRLQTAEERLEAIMQGDEGGLLREMSSAGISEASLPEIRKQLQEYIQDAALGMPNYDTVEQANLYGSSVSTLDDLLNDSFEEGEFEQEEDEDDDDEEYEDDDEDDEDYEDDEDDDGEDVDDDYEYEESEEEILASEEEARLVEEFKNAPRTELEIEKDIFYDHTEEGCKQSLETLEDVEHFKTLRLENETMARARMLRMYEEKEAARRHREWVRRGVWLDKMPMPSSPLR